MSATIPESMRLDDLLKATGYDCPVDLQGKTFDQATEGGGGADLEDNKTVSITENGVVEITPSAGKDGMKKVTATINVSGGGSDVPTEWYLWQSTTYGGYFYLPFETAPDTLDSIKLIPIGTTSVSDTSIITLRVFEYTKNSDTEFTVTDDSSKEPVPQTYTRVTEDVPIGGGSGSATAYAWKDNFNNIRYFSFSEAPDDLTGAKVIAYSDMVSGIEVYNADEAFGSYLKVSAAEFTVAEGKEDLTCTRYTDGDFTLWT